MTALRPTVAAFLALAGLALAAPAAQAQDGIFGSFFSRVGGAEAPKQARTGEARETEARNLRREYWERERARLAQGDLSRQVANRGASPR